MEAIDQQRKWININSKQMYVYLKYTKKKYLGEKQT